MHRGFIKVWRCIEDAGLIQNASALQFSMWCLLKATHKKRKQIVGNESVELLPGQLIFGRKATSRELKTTEAKIRTCIKLLKNTEFLTIETTNKYSVITIINWDTYQAQQPADNQQTTKVQPTLDHKQECKHLRKEKEIGFSGKCPDDYHPDFELFWKEYPGRGGRKNGKRPAFKSWWKVMCAGKVTNDFLIKRIKELRGTYKGYPVDASVWINGNRWEDETSAGHDEEEDIEIC